MILAFRDLIHPQAPRCAVLPLFDRRFFRPGSPASFKALSPSYHARLTCVHTPLHRRRDSGSLPCLSAPRSQLPRCASVTLRSRRRLLSSRTCPCESFALCTCASFFPEASKRRALAVLPSAPHGSTPSAPSLNADFLRASCAPAHSGSLRQVRSSVPPL